MKSVFLNIVNIILVAFVMLVVYLLIWDEGKNSETILSEPAEIFNTYETQKISIKQIDSLSASTNLQFSKKYSANFISKN